MARITRAIVSATKVINMTLTNEQYNIELRKIRRAIREQYAYDLARACAFDTRAYRERVEQQSRDRIARQRDARIALERARERDMTRADAR